jgi:hypothetical protein
MPILNLLDIERTPNVPFMPDQDYEAGPTSRCWATNSAGQHFLLDRQIDVGPAKSIAQPLKWYFRVNP